MKRAGPKAKGVPDASKGGGKRKHGRRPAGRLRAALQSAKFATIFESCVLASEVLRAAGKRRFRIQEMAWLRP